MVKNDKKRQLKRDKKKQQQQQQVNSTEKDNKSNVAEDLYKEVPDSNFTRSISNPEIVMARRRQQKLEQKLKQIKNRDGGGTLKVFGDTLKPDIPYKTLLMSNQDTAAFAVKETLEKYGLNNEDPDNYCLVQVISPSREERDHGAHTKEFILDDNACPLAILMQHPPASGSIIFQIRRCPPDILTKRRVKRLENQQQHQPLPQQFLQQQAINIQKQPQQPVQKQPQMQQQLLLMHITNTNQLISPFKLAPVYAMYMMLRYRLSHKYCDNNLQLDEKLNLTIPLIHKMVNMIREAINLNHLNKTILPYWLANSSEFLYFLKKDADLSKISLE
jgi:hypothetical protein